MSARNLHRWGKLRFRKKIILPVVAVSLICLTLSGAICAQSVPQIRGAINNAETVRLEHTTHPLVQTLSDAGPVEREKPLERMLLVLSPATENQAELKELLDEQQNPRSPNFHRWLTAQQFGARFGVADADVQAVLGWLRQMGFTVGAVAQGKQWLEFSGTAQQVENAFHTQLRYYSGGGKKCLANANDVSIPEAVAQVSRGVASLNNFGKRPPPKMIEGIAGRNALGQKVRPRPNLTATGVGGNVNYLAPGDFAMIYNTKPLLSAGIDGTGVSDCGDRRNRKSN